MTSASRNPDKRQTHLSWHVGSAGKLSKVPRKGTLLEYMYEAPRNMAGIRVLSGSLSKLRVCHPNLHDHPNRHAAYPLLYEPRIAY